MFVDFDNVFHNDSGISIPRPLVDYYSNQLPEGLIYEEEDGFLVAKGENSNETRIGKIAFAPSPEQKKVLGENATFQDAIFLMNNSQQPLRIVAQDGETITFNQKTIGLDQMMINPCGNSDNSKNHFFIKPVPFPDPVPMHLKNDKYEMILRLSRVPNNSIHVIKAESEKDKPLVLRLSIDTKTHISNVTIAYNLGCVQTVQELVECLSLFYSFFNGTAFIDGQIVPVSETLPEKMPDEKNIHFWEKVLELERVLNLQFVPPVDDVSEEDVFLIEQLFQSLINKTPTRNVGRINGFRGQIEEIHEVGMKEVINKPVEFTYNTESNIQLFGQSFDLCSFVGIFNVCLLDYRINGDEIEVEFRDENKSKQSFMSTMYFLTKEQLVDYQNDYTVAIERLKNSKSVLEYID
ncbi:MAG: hypothetical protein IJU56_07525 [Clostridia bacterium]|nr:hypothetical protein [Clostridia bacterium]